jgi:hypothetical protein
MHGVRQRGLRLLWMAGMGVAGFAACADESGGLPGTTSSSGGSGGGGGGGTTTTTTTTGGQDGGGGAAPALAPALYPSDRTHSPITPYVLGQLTEVLALNPASARDRFMKVGDSITASSAFLYCFAGANVELGAHAALQATLDVYRGASVLGTTSFDRDSNVVQSGRTAFWAMDGQPSPLVLEMDAVHPAVGVVMFGTNDIGWYGSDHLATLDWYHGYMFDLVDAMLARGIIPILSTIPPRDDDSTLDAWVPTFNATIRAFAQGRQIPLVDLHRELLPLAAHGLSGDGIHPNASGGGACVLSADGLTYGYNVRNLITLEALDRVRRAALADEGAPDETAPTLAGQGTVASPFLVVGEPFVDVRDTSSSTSRSLDVYDGCGSTADESGPEFVYRLEIASPVRIRAIVLDRGNVDIDVHLLDASATTSGCLARNDALLEADLTPGTYHIVLDTFVAAGTENSGEYVFVLMTCPPGDPACLP